MIKHHVMFLWGVEDQRYTFLNSTPDAVKLSASRYGRFNPRAKFQYSLEWWHAGTRDTVDAVGQREIFTLPCLKLDSTRRSPDLHTGTSNIAINSVAIKLVINLRTQEHRRYCHCKLITMIQHTHDVNYLISAITPALMSTFKTPDNTQERN